MKTPKITADADSGRISIEGICVPENSFDFFEPLKEWIDEYCKSPASSTIFEVRLEYFNTSTSLILLQLFKLFLPLHKNQKVQIIWFYDEDDLDMREAGEEYFYMLDHQMIEFKPIS